MFTTSTKTLTKKARTALTAKAAAEIANKIIKQGIIAKNFVDWCKENHQATFTERDLSNIKNKTYQGVISLQKMNAIHAFLDLYLQADTLDTPETI